MSSDDVGEASNLDNELHRYDEEMTHRANEAYERDNLDATPRHREHGWYLPNDEYVLSRSSHRSRRGLSRK